jgi:hypothetical protein
MKRCAACLEFKPFSEYGPSTINVDRLRGRCKPCLNEQARTYKQRSAARKEARKQELVYEDLMRSDEVRARFWAKVDRRGDDECWPWTGSHHKGYGRFNVGPWATKAHRFSWEIANNRVFPEGLIGCHECDNPNCVNPRHTEPGTYAKNNRDAIDRGLAKPTFAHAHRARASTTHCKRGHEYNEINTIKRADGGRGCRECMKIVRPEFDHAAARAAYAAKGGFLSAPQRAVLRSLSRDQFINYKSAMRQRTTCERLIRGGYIETARPDLSDPILVRLSEKGQEAVSRFRK